MGVLDGLLLLPFTGPAKGLLFILEKIKEQVDAEQLDEGLVEDQLMALSLRYDLGEMSEADYMEQETALLARLNDIRVYKEDLAKAEQERDSDEDDEDG